MILGYLDNGEHDGIYHVTRETGTGTLPSLKFHRLVLCHEPRLYEFFVESLFVSRGNLKTMIK